MGIDRIITTTVLTLALIIISTTTAAALSCSDCDICVNQSGWWRDGGELNASTMPIQAAVDNATAGETICVAAGSYTENVNVNKQITLAGEGADVVTVTAASSSDHVFDVTADYVNISGFNATGANVSGMAGIYLSSADHCNISENNCSNNDYGIFLASSSNDNTLASNNANSNNANGIFLFSSSNNTLTGNNFNSNNGYGIFLGHPSNDNTLASNTANSNNKCGIYLGSSSNNTLANNTANSNNADGIFLGYSSNNTLANNTANSNNADGISLLSFSNDNTLTGNNFNSNNADGIYLSHSSNNTLASNNASSNNKYGISLYYSSNYNTLASNTANSNNDHGIYLYTSSDNTLTGNTMSGNSHNFGVYGSSLSDYTQNIDTSNTVDGKPIYYWVDQKDRQIPSDAGFVGVVNGTNITVKDLTLTNNSQGVLFAYTENSRIVNVTASNNWRGIDLDGSSGNTLTSNNASSNNGYGIFLHGSSGNTFTGNNASNNADGIFLGYSSNNTLTSNTASNNNFGIYLSSSSGNLIYNNYFSNTNNALDNGNNQWNITKTNGTNIIGGDFLGGNYWSDYVGSDMDDDDDGLGDCLLPYNSSGDIQKGGDLHPLTVWTLCNCICVSQCGWWRDNGSFNASTTPIQAAVDNATAGDVICVKAGSYTENVNVNKRLTLAGEGAGAVTVTAANTGDHVFDVTADYVNISGFTVTGATNAYGICLSSVDHCNIFENNCLNNYDGIYLGSSSNNTLTSNTANSNDYYGICLESSSDNTLTGNTASNNDEGIYLRGSSDNTLTSNTASNNMLDGIFLHGSSNNTLTNNTANSNNRYGILLYYSSNNTLTSNTANSNEHYIYGGYGIRLESSSDNTLTGNNASSNDYYGIWLYGSSNNTLASNTADSNDYDGIYLRGSSNNTLTSNNFNSNDYYGIWLYDSSNNTLTSNTASNNTNWDIYIEGSDSTFTNNTLNGTTVSFTYGGVVSLKGVGSPAADPAGQQTIGKFISATNQSAGAWLSLNFSYSEADVSGLAESDLKVWKHNGTMWIEDGWNGTRYLDTTGNVVGVNITSFSVFAPAAATPCNCSCGDICANETGWWRDGGALNASTTPIQAAVDNANADETICVAAGSYNENVDITTPHLTLAGEGAGVVTVTAASSSDHVFDVTADYVNISGFNATGATGSGKAGIYLSSADHCNISDNIASNNGYGISLYYSSNGTLTGNTADSNNYNGIYLEDSSNSTLIGNNASNNYYGISLYYSSNITLTNNTASDNNNDGFQIRYSSNNNILLNNTAHHNSLSGIYLYNSSDSTLTGNNASTNNIYGIYLEDSSNNTLTGNTADSNNNSGIYMNYSSNYNNFTSNNCSNNNYGIYISSSSNNKIYNNYFNNTNNAWDNGNNNWNITRTAGINIIGENYLGGNYWSDYAGIDINGDGLGNTLLPYNSSGNITNGGDDHPLVPTGHVFNCTCGDICVNETGWWYNGGPFIASNTPIKHAIDNATACDTICVKDGTYNENVDVGKRVTIKSENGSASTAVQAASATDHVFEVSADYVNISGFNVTGSGMAGICLNGTDHCNISENNCSNNYFGISLGSSSNYNNFTGNNCSNNDYGIYLSSSSNNTLANNTANSNNKCGIYMGYLSNYNTLANNTADSNDWGIWLSYSSSNTLTNNTADSNNKCGIHMSSSSNYNNFTGNNCSNNNYGIYISSSSSNTLTGNNASSNTQWDISIENSDSTFTDNTLNGTTVSFAYGGDVSLKGVGSPAADPAGQQTIGKFISATNQSAGAWLFLNFSYSEADVSGLAESDLKVWKHNGTMWLEDGWNGIRYLDITENVVGVNITSFSVFAPAAPLENYIPPDPTDLLNTTGNYWVNYTWSAGGTGNVTDSYNVSMNGTWTNGTTDTFMNTPVNPSGWANITVFAYNASGTGTLSAGNVSDNVQAPVDTTPPVPTGLQNTTGNYWVNYTWSAGTGVVTDGYNVSMNEEWYNTTEPFLNSSVGAGNWSNITVWAWNKTGSGNMSATSVSDNVQAPAVTVTPPAVTVLRPDGQEEIPGDSVYDITWNVTAGTYDLAADPINISYSNDSGASWSSIASDEPDDGRYSWSVPNINSSNCTVNVTVRDIHGNTGSDVSNSTFTILETDNSTTETIPDGETTTVEGPPESNTTVNVTADGNVTVTIAYYNETPHPGADEPDGMVPKYIDIAFSDNDNVTWPIYVVMHYTDAEVEGLNESDLGLYYYKDGEWDRCNDTGVNVTGNYIWANVTADECPGSPFGAGGATATTPLTFTPPDPTNLQNTTGGGYLDYWVNYTWAAGTGNVTDSYNVSMNDAWTNGTAATFMNVSVDPCEWANITVFAYNASGTGTLSEGSVSDEVQAPCDTTPPVIIITTPVPYETYTVGTKLNFSATDDESGVDTVVGNLTNLSGVSWNVDGDNSFDPEVGVYTLVVNATDNASNTNVSDPVFFVVYDPEGGSATGEGWFDPNGESTRAKAEFEFAVKYKNDVSTGKLEFKDKDDDIKLKSASIDWLVISNRSAQFQGTGTINREDYTFRVRAEDNSEPGVGSDHFDIKIWNGTDTEADPIYKANNTIADGNIVVHT